MKFELSMSKSMFDKTDVKRYEELGFIFEEMMAGEFHLANPRYVESEKPPPIIEFNTLEELVGFIRGHGSCILTVHNDWTADLEIYNDYRE